MPCPRALPRGPVAALLLAGTAALVLAASDLVWTRTQAEAVATGGFLLGWGLAVVAFLATGTGVVQTVRGTDRRPTRAGLLAAAGLLLLAAVLAHPVVGSGGGAA
ncbi:hypothetical protein AB1207_17775 [Kineococcus endophyticus]|uniref:Uncharacterized protein n=1 Tax=Kineococcus endophyticus TaxID=1181883 RepID=A0ABV3PAE5_9ACTN